ncbi:hypothetical protein AJ80_00224 [Polytolypa hystricis UAMH7299]|uniref:Meiotically up-regulated gene 154 protein n=1 Tax=Polytolypa hystricis (strain UAMH7299) TaxID=1447883 RepID=A0A2B7Z3I5_POLH7|nr:hypothetical protein AJ80_00224 [Polytolypa hystricis UAMH7299]
MPPLIRRRPLLERIKAYLNPLDFLLWLSEELDSSDWEQWERDWAIPIGVAVNVMFLVARANSRVTRSAQDDVFGDEEAVSWLSWFASFIVHLLGALSAINAFYTFWRKRHYRLFEASIDDAPATPSAHRVQVNSSPIVSSPLRFLANIMSIGSAEARAHPSAERDVWELGVWDPHPLSIRLFCLFSPGHVLVYWLFLPTTASDPRPSVTIVTTLFVAALLTVQMSMLSSSFSRQSKDTTLVHKEVFNEYDTKYVHPRTQPLVRDVSTQFSEQMAQNPLYDENYNRVDTFTPTLKRQGFKISPNPNYIKHIDPEGALSRQRSRSSRQSLSSPSVASISSSIQTDHLRSPSYTSDASTPIRSQHSTAMRQPQFRPSSRSGAGDGGSLGVYSHAASPLRKSTPTQYFDQRGSHHRAEDFDARPRSPVKQRSSSPLKRSSVPGEVGTAAAAQRWGHLASPARGVRRESGRF